MKDIRYLFEPRSIAIIGASREEGKIGYAVLKNIIEGGYAGRIYPVNPSGGEIAGLRAYRDITEIEGEVDLAVVTIPARLVLEAVQGCTRKGVGYGIVITSGFSEIGRIAEEREIIASANDGGMRILGPNVFGVFSAPSRLNATFVSGRIPTGHLAMITQSGALGITMIGRASVEHMGLSHVVSVGNKADLDESDLLDYLVEQAETRVILMYIEGVRNGNKFIRALQKATRRKPVVLIKSGRSQRGAVAAASHTGSLAGADEVFEDIIRQCGALRAENTIEAFNWSKVLASTPLPKGDQTVIITNGGGAGVMATDACEKYGIHLYDDSQDLKDTFSPATPAFGSTKNPIDITGQAGAADYTKAFAAALANNHIHAAVGIYCESALFTSEHLVEAIDRNYQRFKEAGKPLVFTLIGGQQTADYEQTARRNDIPAFGDVYPTVSSLGAMYAYKHYLDEGEDKPLEPPIDGEAIDQIVARARGMKRYFLLAAEAEQVMALAGIRTPRSAYGKTLAEAALAAEAVGYPVAMKIVSKDIIHKSDVGGIALDLDNRAEVMDAFGTVMHNSRSHMPHALIEGVQISEMIQPGIEVITGARQDTIFGPIVMVGLGGVYVEVMKDVSFRALPLGHRGIQGMIRELRSYPLLQGVRGEKIKDLETLIDTIGRLGTILLKCKGISDIEINPLVVYEQGQGAVAVDARIILFKEEQEVR